MEPLRIFGMTADLFGVFICTVEFITFMIWHKYLDRSGKYLLSILCLNALSLLSNFIGLLFKEMEGQFIHNILILSNFCEFGFGYILSFVFTIYLIFLIEREGHFICYKKWVIIYTLISLVLLVISQFNGMFYYINSANYYVRGSLFYISQMFGIGSMMIDVFFMCMYRKYLSQKEFIALAMYIVLPIAALLIQIQLYGVYLLLISETISIAILFLVMLSSMVKKYYDKEQEVNDMKILLMMSQIQPHFLYNTLSAIKHLCKSNPDEAANTVEDFSRYLRSNMDALSLTHCIPFSQELKHIKSYLSIEKKRFGKRLRISFDIQEENFYLPPLSVQPLVENAVKYGTLQKMEGVDICISNYCDNDYFYIKIKDNGLGFDPYHYQDDHKVHIGIEGVKKRLETMCNGLLSIKSQRGIGTEIIISILKEQV